MTFQVLSDPNTPLSDVLKAAGSEGLLLASEGQASYAVMPLDDDLLDYLIERDPKFIEACRQIRERMRAGRFHTHDQVKTLLAAQ